MANFKKLLVDLVVEGGVVGIDGGGGHAPLGPVHRLWQLSKVLSEHPLKIYHWEVRQWKGQLYHIIITWTGLWKFSEVFPQHVSASDAHYSWIGGRQCYLLSTHKKEE